MKSKKSIDQLIREKTKLPLPAPDAEALWKDMVSRLDTAKPTIKPGKFLLFWTLPGFKGWLLACAGVALAGGLYWGATRSANAHTEIPPTGIHEEHVGKFPLPAQSADVPEIARALPDPAGSNAVLSKQESQPGMQGSMTGRDQVASPQPLQADMEIHSIQPAASPSEKTNDGIASAAISGGQSTPVSDPTTQSGIAANPAALTQAGPADNPNLPKKIDFLLPLEPLQKTTLLEYTSADRPIRKVICPALTPSNRLMLLVYLGVEPLKTSVIFDGRSPSYLFNAGVGVRQAFKDGWYGQLDLSLNKFRTSYLSYKTVKHAVLNAHDVQIDSVRPAHVTGLSLNFIAGKQFRFGTSLYAGIQAGYLFSTVTEIYNRYYENYLPSSLQSASVEISSPGKLPAWMQPIDIGLRLGIEQRIYSGFFVGAMMRQGLLDMTKPAGAYTTYTNFVVYGGCRF
jgi:hypothetical protein